MQQAIDVLIVVTIHSLEGPHQLSWRQGQLHSTFHAAVPVRLNAPTAKGAHKDARHLTGELVIFRIDKVTVVYPHVGKALLVVNESVHFKVQMLLVVVPTLSARWRRADSAPAKMQLWMASAQIFQH